jgi:hypothetical protein
LSSRRIDFALRRFAVSRQEPRAERESHDPVPGRIQELQANGKPVVGDRLAVGHAGKRSEGSGERCDRQAIVLFPMASAENARAARADVLRECGFRAGQQIVPRNLHANFHGNTRLAARRGERLRDSHPKTHLCCPHTANARCQLRFTRPLFSVPERSELRASSTRPPPGMLVPLIDAVESRLPISAVRERVRITLSESR